MTWFPRYTDHKSRLLRPLAVHFKPHSAPAPTFGHFVTAHRIGNENIDVLALDFSAAVFNCKMSSTVQNNGCSKPILRQKRNKIDLGTKRDAWICRDCAPVNGFSVGKTAVAVLRDIDANRTIAISSNGVQMLSPKMIISKPQGKNEDCKRKNFFSEGAALFCKTLQASIKRGGLVSFRPKTIRRNRMISWPADSKT